MNEADAKPATSSILASCVCRVAPGQIPQQHTLQASNFHLPHRSFRVSILQSPIPVFAASTCDSHLHQRYRGLGRRGMKLKQSFPAHRSAWLDHIVSALMQGNHANLAEKIVNAMVLALATTSHRLQHARRCVVIERDICNAGHVGIRVCKMVA